MNKNVAILFFLISSSLGYGQTTPQAFEYLVVSPGKGLFNLPQKALAYFTLDEVKDISEASNIQTTLNILGKYGWELAGIVGMIGGDQQLMMKRRLDAKQVAEDLKIAQKRTEERVNQLVLAMKQDQEEAKKLEEALVKRTMLVDLDRVDELNREKAESDAILAVRNTYREGLKDALKLYSPVIDDSNGFSQWETVFITFDLTTTHLRNKNEFRSAAVLEFLNAKLQEISQIVESYPYEPTTASVTIKVIGMIKLGSESHEVGTVEKRITVNSSLGRSWDY